MAIRDKLMLGFSLLLLIMTIAVAVSISILHKQSAEINEMVHSRFEKLKLVNQIDVQHSSIGNKLQRVLLDPASLEREAQGIEEYNEKILLALHELFHMKMNEEERAIFAAMQLHTLSCHQEVNLLLGLVERDKSDVAKQLFLTDHVNQRREFGKLITSFDEVQKASMTETMNESYTTYNYTVKLIIAFLALAFFVGIAATIWTVRAFTISFGRVLEVIRGASQENSQGLQRIEVISKDEIGAISLAYNQLVETIERQSAKEQAYVKNLENENWIEMNIAEFTLLFDEIMDFSTLAKAIVSKLTPLIKASHSALYFIEGKEDAQLLKPVASYGSNDPEFLAKSFRLGEGLVGQCALERQKILIRDIPPEYLKIRSGLGKASPDCLCLLPIGFEQTILGVLELAAFTELEPHQHKLMQRVINLLGIKLFNLANQLRVQELLVESQTKTEELQVQSEELQNQHEELKTINEQLEQQFQESKNKSQELQKAKTLLEELSQQLAQQSQSKTEFLANMSHELRTPMNSMLVLAQVIAENKEGNLTDKQVEYAHSIHEAGKDLLIIINDILDLSKVELGKLEIYPSVVNLSNLKKTLESEYTTIAVRNGIFFKVESELYPEATLITDEQRLMQILRNLLHNAFKFTEKGGVTLKFHKFRGDGTLPITVTDTGIGIPKDKQEIIFEVSRQAGGFISRKYGGSGLGLPISKNLASLLEGTIEVISQEGVGSIFTLCLPPLTLERSDFHSDIHTVSDLIADTVEEFSAQRESSVSLAGKKVLIVDDDMRSIFALTTLLETQSMKVIFAENGKESLEALKSHPDVDIVLMDIMMPEWDGYTTIEALRSVPLYKDLPIIALTAKAMKNDRDSCLEAGASDYISKPIRVEQLLSLLREWLFREKG